jgi:hypothetical protein
MFSLKVSRPRSIFWINIYENEDRSVVISTSDKVKFLVDREFPLLSEQSPYGWRKNTSVGYYNLWLPEDRVNDDMISLVRKWATEANQFLWLGTNKNIEVFFKDELDYCIAADWTYNFENDTRTAVARTAVGEAMYAIKYKYGNGEMSRDEALPYDNTLSTAIDRCFKFLPINSPDLLVVTSIPSTQYDQEKLSWRIARYTAEKLNALFLTATLSNEKVQTKNLSVDDKIKMWQRIYASDKGLVLSLDVNGREVLIVDDLYQSGASMWCFAKFLKHRGASKVIGLAAVKSLKDTDNT